MPTLLIADDDDRTRQTLAQSLAADGYTILEAFDGLGALRKLQDERIDLLLLDLKMPNPDGMTILRAMSNPPPMPVIVLTAHGTVAVAVEAIKLGAYDFLEKPIDIDHLRLTIRRALEQLRLQREHGHLLAQLQRQAILTGNSRGMRQVRDLIAKVAPLPVTVLIDGESGTGKELVAKAIHAASPQAGCPYIVMNCAALPDSLVESELFGHARGAFTGAVARQTGKIQLADHGTLFLDEVGDMSLSAQAKILRVLETGELEPLGGRSTTVTVRTLAATNKNLIAEINAGRFREDLYHRLNVVTVKIPPLRERAEDIPALVDHFMAAFSRDYPPPRTMSPDALQLLTGRNWPGNVRELKHAIQKLLILVDKKEITGEDVVATLNGSVTGVQAGRASLRALKQQFERKQILSALIAHRWNVEAAARALSIGYTYMYKKIKTLGIEIDRSNGRG